MNFGVPTRPKYGMRVVSSGILLVELFKSGAIEYSFSRCEPKQETMLVLGLMLARSCMFAHIFPASVSRYWITRLLHCKGN